LNSNRIQQEFFICSIIEILTLKYFVENKLQSSFPTKNYRKRYI